MGDDPIETRRLFGEYAAGSFENPTDQSRIAHIGLYPNACHAQCIAYHVPTFLDPFEKKETFTTVPPFGQNAYSVSMCIYQCFINVAEILVPETATYLKTEVLEKEFNLQGVTYSYERPDIFFAWQYLIGGNSAPMMNILEAEDYHPLTMGHVAGFRLAFLISKDGFNVNGRLKWSPKLKRAMPCTGNCIMYSDTTGYVPVADPRKYPSADANVDGYNCTGTCGRWQPIEELSQDGTGSIASKQFSMPHIGEKAITRLRPATLTLDDPEYDFYNESLLVIERLKDVASNEYRKNVMDVCFGANMGIHAMRYDLGYRAREIGGSAHSFYEEMMTWFGLSLGEYDGIIQSWKEKVYHDIARPTTIIRHWDDDLLYTYGGDPKVNGPVSIRARDFMPIRPNMPSSEFPSASSCSVTTMAEFFDVYVQEMYNQTFNNITTRYADVTFADSRDVVDKCSEGLSYSGTHFSAAAAAGEKICSGLGQLAYDYITNLKNGTAFGREAWYPGDTIPPCGSA